MCSHTDDAIKHLEFENRDYIVCHQCGTQFAEKGRIRATIEQFLHKYLNN